MEKRRTQLANIDGLDVVWEDIEFVDLKDKDIFRMFEPDGLPVKDENGNVFFKAEGFPYPFINERKESTWAIKQNPTVLSLPVD
ncbi:MAG: hypothetical protein ACOC2U_04380 [bacterium]